MTDNTAISKEKYFKNDEHFNKLYPINIQQLATRHWTSIDIAKLSVGFLGSKGSKILDIGSGVGKFCLTGAYYAPNVQFYGIEQRKYLIDHALHAQEKLDLRNVSFIHGNFIQLNLRDFDHFYFFNSFHENIDYYGRIDKEIDYSESLYNYYVSYLYKGLQQMPKGTKIVSYHSLREIPIGYELVETLEYGDLNFWIKQ